ncbi:NAD(P)(+) transhydrogenase (Re/Si-specific) subunit beta [uncultured Desulfovibrio sp.]|uniref:NAD(P)(+) transhydrogenase (Re/Si-specific) subunit beta n=1 Tax=uncultured Desulfovibrio sp. TaxID=167968 RepID=UPI002803C0AF|nr:NAD(P)(+) transhydrogenase (Re/Si-specific) subunit beta [uncultured Desulfovibrio sp.]
MNALTYNFIAVILVATILFGLRLMNKVPTAVRGNLFCASAMGMAIFITMFKDGSLTSPSLWLAIAAGMALGLTLSNKVKMIQMPQMVAFLHGIGGGAAAIVSFLVLTDTGAPSTFERGSACLALAMGMTTIAGSFVAAGKLHQVLPQKPVILPGHTKIIMGILAGMGFSVFMGTIFPSFLFIFFIFMMFMTGIAFGVCFTIRVGGADMPITISLLNSMGGVCAAIAGFAVNDPLLVAIGGIIGSSGFLLTRIMCRAMNRKLLSILLGESSVVAPAAPAPKAVAAQAPSISSESDVARLVQQAQKVIIVPGYGMALAQAQHHVKSLADALENKGVEVRYGIHPVAGRMPGHMNVLLAEANVDYEHLLEMDTVNPMFAQADLVVIIGANDVVNPAANTAEGTPIYGMPILKVEECRNIIICNYDDKPGYAGVPNPLYGRDGVILMSGDAAKTVNRLVRFAQGESPAEASGTSDKTDSREVEAEKLVQNAKNVVIVPGYGMALAQAQYKVKELADLLESAGAKVSYGIHPVAGRMPGHMNVLLAEANVDYEHLLEMDTVNPMFAESDLVIVVGANDVVNPAANTAEGTPIYGMPILKVEECKNIIICNYDDKPGYAGVPNPLYERAGVILMTGDAAKSMEQLIRFALRESTTACLPASSSTDNREIDATMLVQNAKNVVIVPGYGMALAQAQYKVKELADLLESAGAKVSYGIHPVAGRMPGHMNVLLAEANVDYEHLLEMDTVNPMFAESDLVIVVGANDVVNPAANTAEGTPIYGMPILKVEECKNIIICNYDDKPGYAGVPNPLYERAGVILMTGDASNSFDKLLSYAQEGQTYG